MPNIGTVYGGYFTLNRDGSVTVVVTHAIKDLGDLTWDLQSATDVRQEFRSRASSITDHKADIVPTCSMFKGMTREDQSRNVTINSIAIIASSGKVNVYIKPDSYQSGSAFKTAVTGQKLVYELATPLTYTLSASVLNSLIGQNNVWADAGNVSVKAWGF